MTRRKIWLVVVLLIAGFCLTSQAWGRKTLSRGQIAHTLEKEGWSGREDNNRKMGNAGFGYPMGRWLKNYSGGGARDGLSPKANTAGEGFWIMSKTNGQVHISWAGNNKFSGDIIPIDFQQGDWPEAYLGVVHDEDWALSIRKNNGGEADWAQGVPLSGLGTNWWPRSGDIEPASEIKRDVAMIWNFRYGRYNADESYASRISAGEFGQSSAPAWAEALSEDDFPEQIGIQQAKSSETGVQWTRKWYEWGHADYDDFIINENVIENTSGSTVENIYINFQNRFAQQMSLVWRPGRRWYKAADWSRDDHARSTASSNYLAGVTREAFVQGAGKPAGLQGLKDLAEQGYPLLYYHDGESQHIDNLIPDVGDPIRIALLRQRYANDHVWIPEGLITQGQYFGIGPIDAFPPFNTYGGADTDMYVNPHDNPGTSLDESQQQPASITMWRYTGLNDYEQPVPFRHHDAFLSDEHVYDTLTQAGYTDEPDQEYMYTHHMTFGPWTLAPGEKAKVVVAYVGGMGGNAPKYADYRKYPQPFNFAWLGLFNGTRMGDLEFKDRQPEIPLGEDALYRHYKRAHDVYNWGYDLPNQPPNIKIATRSNLQGQLTVSWPSFGEDATDPDYAGAEAQDLRGYRIYRSEAEGQGPWTFVDEFSFNDGQSGNVSSVQYDPSAVWRTGPTGAFGAGIPLTSNKYVPADDPKAGTDIPGTYVYTDKGTKAGFNYWYSVRYYDTGHADWNGTGKAIALLESAPGPSGGASLGGRFGVVPVVPGHAIFDNMEERIKLVPNVWKVDDDLHTYQRQAKIRFTNLPGRARIDLYTVDGQRFWTFYHDNLNEGEATYIQFTETRPSQFGESLFPGIYFWKVTSLMPESQGETQMGPFLIIK